LNDERVAEDIASEVFLRLLEALRRGAGPQTNVKGWLMSTANHMIVDHLRRTYRHPHAAIPEDMIDQGPAPSAEYDRRERTRLFRRAYARLTAEQQQVLALRFNDGCSIEETAELMGKNVNAVKALQFRALQAVQRHLGEAADDTIG
jgi:RNA polymerase sigma-70 factor (ECF subfamily)